MIVVGAPGMGNAGTAILLLLDALEHRDIATVETGPGTGAGAVDCRLSAMPHGDNQQRQAWAAVLLGPVHQVVRRVAAGRTSHRSRCTDSPSDEILTGGSLPEDPAGACITRSVWRLLRSSDVKRSYLAISLGAEPDQPTAASPIPH